MATSRSVAVLMTLLVLVCRSVAAEPDLGLVDIPSGTAQLGDADGDDNEVVESRRIEGFRVMRLEVTNAQFAAFVSATGHRTDPEISGEGYVWWNRWRLVKGADWRHPNGPQSSITGLDEHPVMQVSARDAEAFCAITGCVCQPTQNGSTPRAAVTAGDILGEMSPLALPVCARLMPARSAAAAPTMRMAICGLRLSAITPPGDHRSVCSIWPEMFGSGRPAAFQANLNGGPSKAVAGVTTPIACALPIGTAIARSLV